MSGISITYARRKNIPDPIPLPLAHRHDSDVPFPVIGFDFNKTLTPAENYPIEAGPFPRVKEVLQALASKGCCLHIMTAGMYYGPQDIPVFLARQRAIQAWCDQYDLPVSFIGGKVPSDVFYDNDFIGVPEKPDWDEIGEQIATGLSDRFKLAKGTYIPIPHAPVGTPMPDDLPVMLPMAPRGYSTARLDVDFHRTLFTASSSTRYSAPKPHAAEIINAFYAQGITVRLSCAGWSPLSHSSAESDERFNGLVWQCEKYGILFDRIVTKDFHHVGVDDKGIHAADWERDLPLIKAKLAEGEHDAPELQFPA